MTCRFEGSVTEVRLEGLGPVKLSAREAFSKPFVALVELKGTQIRGAPGFLRLGPAIELEPVDLDLSDGDPPYKVAYRATRDGAEPGFTLMKRRRRGRGRGGVGRSASPSRLCLAERP
jgi:hypothetical protein